jgi:hypothetical protein
MLEDALLDLKANRLLAPKFLAHDRISVSLASELRFNGRAVLSRGRKLRGSRGDETS